MPQGILGLESAPDSSIALLTRKDLEVQFGAVSYRIRPPAADSCGGSGPLVWELTASGLLKPEDEALRPVVYSGAIGRAVPTSVTRLEPVKWDETSVRFRIEVSRPAVGSLDALEVSLARWLGEDHIDFLLGEPALAVVLPDAAACAQANECPAELLSDLHALITVGSSHRAIVGQEAWLGVADHVVTYCQSSGDVALESLVRGQVRALLLSADRKPAAATAEPWIAHYRRRRSLYFWTPLLLEVILLLRWTAGDFRGVPLSVWLLVAAGHGLNLYTGLAPPRWQLRLQPVSGLRTQRKIFCCQVERLRPALTLRHPCSTWRPASASSSGSRSQWACPRSVRPTPSDGPPASSGSSAPLRSPPGRHRCCRSQRTRSSRAPLNAGAPRCRQDPVGNPALVPAQPVRNGPRGRLLRVLGPHAAADRLPGLLSLAARVSPGPPLPPFPEGCSG